MNAREQALIERVWARAPDFQTADQYKSFLRGVRRDEDSDDLKRALSNLIEAYEVFYG